MALKTVDQLKLRYETGDVPTQADYEDLIESSLNRAETSAQSVIGPVSFTNVSASAMVAANATIGTLNATSGQFSTCSAATLTGNAATFTAASAATLGATTLNAATANIAACSAGAINATTVSAATLTVNRIVATSGLSGSVGKVTLSAGGASVSANNLTDKSYIFLQATNDSNLGTKIRVSIVSGSRFVIQSSDGLDASTFNWWRVDGV